MLLTMLQIQEVIMEVLWGLQSREGKLGSATLQKLRGRRATFEGRSEKYEHCHWGRRTTFNYSPKVEVAPSLIPGLTMRSGEMEPSRT